MSYQEPIEVFSVVREGLFMKLSVEGERWWLLKGHMDPEFYESFEKGTIYGTVAEEGDGYAIKTIKDYIEFRYRGKKIYPIYNGIFPMPGEKK
jgi:hypothetical protein